eukprot:787537-Alexandrium_andersonii.AAC.1
MQSSTSCGSLRSPSNSCASPTRCPDEQWPPECAPIPTRTSGACLRHQSSGVEWRESPQRGAKDQTTLERPD